MKAAKEKAEYLLESVGKKIGDIVSVKRSRTIIINQFIIGVTVIIIFNIVSNSKCWKWICWRKRRGK